MKNIVVGVLAHVDAGKTTLSEAMLYLSGTTDRLGRVDRRDAHLDTHALERERGITVFSKQAIFDTGDTHITLIDTPGHIDFSCETERTLAIEDYAVLIISATDGVTAHTRTLWRLLAARRIPAFIFVNKTDLSTRLRREICDELKCALSTGCIDFNSEGADSFFEEVAASDERLMAGYFEGIMPTTEDIAERIRARKIFPCFFGSALRLEGVRELLSGIDRYTLPTEYQRNIFGAKVYKISRDKSGARISFAKITGGILRPKDTVEIRRGADTITEKVEQIRVFSAERSTPLKEALPGDVVALYGLSGTAAGMGLGFEANDVAMLEPPLCYRMILPDGTDPHATYLALSQLAEEDPSLSLSYDSESREIKVSLMGEIQKEVLVRLIADRLGIEVGFDEGRILYRETILGEVIGSGHFEPVGHYAEVHLRIEPLDEGSGVVCELDCDRDRLALNWQRLIATHVEERVHRGVLVGAPLTDVKITVIGGRAHQKHTVGGDFRAATYRAIRQGLMKAESVLLEPTFEFRIELPVSNLGRLLTDISNMHGEIDSTEADELSATVTGVCPVATIRSYPMTLRAYTHGHGQILLTPGEYRPAHNASEVVESIGYTPELDERNPAGSVFCRAGAGYSVPWYEADEKMHAPPERETEADDEKTDMPKKARAVRYGGTAEEDKELMRIFEATYGKPKKRTPVEKRVNENEEQKPKRAPKPKKKGEDYLIVDGYNVIHAWDELKTVSSVDLSLARDTLIRLMCSYAAIRRCKVIIVFDAYMVKDGKGSIEKYGELTVIYTKERQTADAYIERTTYEIARENTVRVVTSDMDEQFIILGNGALRVSPKELREELNSTAEEIAELAEKYKKKG